MPDENAAPIILEGDIHTETISFEEEMQALCQWIASVYIAAGLIYSDKGDRFARFIQHELHYVVRFPLNPRWSPLLAQGEEVYQTLWINPPSMEEVRLCGYGDPDRLCNTGPFPITVYFARGKVEIQRPGCSEKWVIYRNTAVMPGGNVTQEKGPA